MMAPPIKTPAHTQTNRISLKGDGNCLAPCMTATARNPRAKFDTMLATGGGKLRQPY